MSIPSKNKTWYLAGPMSGIPQFNYPQFEKVSKELRSRGFTVVSPAELDDPDMQQMALASKDGLTPEAISQWGSILARDIAVLSGCHGIMFLPNWNKSRGACLEAMAGILQDKTLIQLVLYQNDMHMSYLSHDLASRLIFDNVHRRIEQSYKQESKTYVHQARK